MHIAAANGNKIIIDYLINFYDADLDVVTKSGLTVMHCAAQRYEGCFSILHLARTYDV